MSTMMQQLTSEVSKHVIAQITSKLLPAISEKYDISMDELMELVGGAGGQPSQKPTTIKATPKATSKAASTKSSVSASLAPQGILDALQKKIDAARAAGKVLNVSSGRPLADTAANRKKFKFYDELGIAGVAGDPKLSDALQLFGGPPVKKAAPVHEQAAKAKQRAKAMTGSGDEDADTDAEDKATTADEDTGPSSPASPAKPVTSNKKESQPSEESAPKATFSVKKTVIKPKPEAVKPTVVTKPPPKVVQSTKPVVAQPAKDDGDDDGDDGDDGDDDNEETVDTIVKLSNLIEETNTQVDAEENKGNPNTDVTVSEKPLVSRFNPKIKQWWNPDTSFILKRKGVKTFVIGKLVNEQVVSLTDSDIQVCAQNNWQTDLTVVKAAEEQTGSQSDDEDS